MNKATKEVEPRVVGGRVDSKAVFDGLEELALHAIDLAEVDVGYVCPGLVGVSVAAGKLL